MENAAGNPVGGGAEEDRMVEEKVKASSPARRWKMRLGSAGFLAFTDVGRLVAAVAESNAESDVSEWERSEQEERRADAEELGTAAALGVGDEPPLFLPTHPFMASAGEDLGDE